MENGKTLSYPKEGIKTVLTENIHPEAVTILENEGYPVTTYNKSLSENELMDVLPGKRVLGIRSNTKLTPDAVDAGENLLSVGAFCVGTNQIDLDACTEQGIVVFNDPISNTRSVAELAMGEITMLSRGIVDKNKQLHEGIWDKSAKGSREVRGKTLGIVGYGTIGSQLSEIAESNGMRVIYHDLTDTVSRGNAQRMATLEAVLENADVVSLHVDGRTENRNLIGDKEMEMMKDGAILLNLSRGSVVDLEALSEKIKSGKIRGAAVDVFPKEPSSKDEEFNSPLRGLPNVILSPHVGGSTEEAQERIGGFVAHKIVDFINTGNTMGSVNFPNIQAPPQEDRHRILHVHKNVPGVMADINEIFDRNNMNVAGFHLETNSRIGYAVIDIDQGYNSKVVEELRNVKGANKRKTRILY